MKSSAPGKITQISIITSILFITLIRIYYLYSNNLNLFFDEAQYWQWSKNLDFGYYSKPPMIALTIALFGNYCGDSEFCIRLASPILHLLTTIIVALIAHQLFKNRYISLISSLVYCTLPAVTVSSALISTDPILLFFWSLTLLFFIITLKHQQKTSLWILTGVLAGLGCLSKYNMAIFLPSALLYFFYQRKKINLGHIFANPRLYIAVITAFLVYLPNLIWNYQHQFVSYLHTKEISKIDKELFHFGKFIEFNSAQLIIFGPLALLLLITAGKYYKKLIERDSYQLVFAFTLPFFVIISLLSLLSGAYANWAAPTYIAASILLTAFAYEYNFKRWLAASITLNILLGSLFYAYQPIINYFHITQTNKGKLLSRDPFKRLKGWKELGGEVSAILAQYPGSNLLVSHRRLFTELSYYVTPRSYLIQKFNMSSEIRDHYDLAYKIGKESEGKNFIFVGEKNECQKLKTHFTEVRLIKNVEIRIYPDLTIEYDVCLANDFKPRLPNLYR